MNVLPMGDPILVASNHGPNAPGLCLSACLDCDVSSEGIATLDDIFLFGEDAGRAGECM